MPDLDGGLFGGGGGTPSGGEWVKLLEIDFTALTSTTWTSTDNDTDQDVDGYIFHPRYLTSGSSSVGSSSGMTASNVNQSLWWKINKGANALDLSAKSYLAVVANVIDPPPPSGWAAIQMGSGDWDPCWDFMRFGNTYQIARRQSGGIGYGYDNDALSTTKSSAWLMFCTPWLSSMWKQHGVASGDLPSPEDGSYEFGFCASRMNDTRVWPWSGDEDLDHIALNYSSSYTSGLGVRQLAIYSLEGVDRLD